MTSTAHDHAEAADWWTMLSERARADRQMAVRALVGSAAAVVVTVLLTGGVTHQSPGTNTGAQPPPPQLAFIAE